MKAMTPTLEPTIDMYDPLLTTAQVAKFLQCSESYLEKQRSSGDGIPVVQIGKMRRYNFSDVTDFVERNKQDVFTAR